MQQARAGLAPRGQASRAVLTGLPGMGIHKVLIHEAVLALPRRRRAALRTMLGEVPIALVAEGVPHGFGWKRTDNDISTHVLTR